MVQLIFKKSGIRDSKINIFCVFLLGKNVAKGVWAGLYNLVLFSLELPRAVKFPTAFVLRWYFLGNRQKRIKKKGGI